MRTTLFVVLFLYSAAHFAHAQVLTGQIKGEGDAPLPGVTIRSDSAMAVSDTRGMYRLTLSPGSHRITFRYIDQEVVRNIRLNADETLKLNLNLSDFTNILQEATVTTGKYEKPLGEVTVSLDVLKPRLLESVNATAVDEVITKIPGVAILDRQVSIRGGAGFAYGAGTRTLLLLDDIPILQPDAGSPNWADYPIENIGLTEVLKGAASSLYGSSAMNGIIHLRTAWPGPEPVTKAAVFGKVYGHPDNDIRRWWGRDSSELQLPYETGFSFSHRQQKGKWDLVLGAYGLTRETYNRDTYSHYGRLAPNIRYRVNDRLSLQLNSNFNIGSSGSFFMWANEQEGAYQAGLNSQNRSLRRVRINVDPGLTYFDHSGNRHRLLNRFYYISNKNSGNQSVESQLVYNEYQFQHRTLSDRLVVTTGAVSTFNTVDAPLYGSSKYNSWNLAGYVQGDLKVWDKLNLAAGMRYEYNRLKSPELIEIPPESIDTIPGGINEESKPVFRLGANYQLHEATFLRASWGQGYRYPTIAEKFIRTDFGVGNIIRPNPELVSETGWTAELGIKQGFRLGAWQGYLDVAGFWSEYEGMMEFVLAELDLRVDPGPPPTIAADAYFESQNIGDTRVRGIEASVVGQGALGPGNLFLLTGYTFIDPRYQRFGERENETSSVDYNVLKYRFRHMFRFDVEYVWQKWSGGVSVQYNSHMEAIDAIFELEIIEPFAGVKRFREANNDGFTLLDLRAAYRFNPHWKLSAICGNVLNTAYMLRPALLEAPRNYTLRLDWVW